MGRRHDKPNVPLPTTADRASACAKAVDASTSRGVGTSVTARIPNACVWSGAGRRRGGRPSGARTRQSKPSMPRQNVCAVSAPPLRHNRRSHLRLRRRVVTQQKFFRRLRCATGRGAMNRLLKSGRNQARYCCSACRQAVRRVLDRERKWLWRGTFRGRRAREQEYQAARARRAEQQHDTASATSPRPPPS